MGPTTVTGRERPQYVDEQFEGGADDPWHFLQGPPHFQQHTTKGGPLDQRTEIPLV